MKLKGLNPDYFVSNEQAYAKTNDKHKIASISGNIAGTVTSSMGVGGLVKGGLKKLGVTFAKKWMEPAIVQGITNAVRGGVTEFSAGGDLKDISVNALREGATGAIGGAVGSKVEGAISGALTNPKYANGILNTIKNTRATAITAQTISGVADAAADYATDNVFVGVANKLGANLEYRTGSDVVTDFAVSMVFGFGNKLNTKNSAQLPIKISDYLDNYDLYRRIVKVNGDLEVKINAGKDLVASGNEISRFLDDNIFTGQKDIVDLLKNSIEVVNDTVNISNKIFETELKTDIKLKGVGQTLNAKYNSSSLDVDLAIGNIIDGKATFEDFKLFAPENTANRQALYEATGIKLPIDSRLTNYSLLALNSKNRNIHNMYLNRKIPNFNNITLPEYVKHIENSDTNTKTKDFYLKYDNRLIKPDSLTGNGEGGIIKSGGKINQNNFLKVMEYEKQAVEFYQEICRNNDDVLAISNNTDFSYSDILNIKKHIMSDSIKFKNGTIKQFDPDIDQALAWKRLMNGKNIKETDLLLLRHELEELTIMHEKNMVYEDAHELANKKYNWEDAVENFDDNDELY